MNTSTKLLLLYAACCAFRLSVQAQSPEKNIEYYVQLAPFSMQIPELPTIPNRNFLLEDYGAVGDGQTLNTAAFEKAVAAC